MNTFECTDTTLLLCLIKIFDLKFGFVKWYFIQFHFYTKRSTDNSRGIITTFVSTLMGHQINHMTNIFLSYKTKSCHESDYECICIVINGNTRRFGSSLLSSVLFKPFIFILFMVMSRDHGGKLCFDFGVDILNKMT